MIFCNTLLIDLDGTLIDSMPALFGSYRDFLGGFGIVGSPEEFNKLNGSSMAEAIRTIITRYDLPLSFEQGCQSYQKYFLERYLGQCKLFPGVVEFLESARNNGIKLAIVTAANQETSSQVLSQLEILRYFDALVTPEGLPRGKPFPDVYLEALKRMEATSQEALAIEDGANGIRAALSAQLTTWRFAGYSLAEKLDSSLQERVETFYSWEKLQRAFANRRKRPIAL